MVDLFIQGGPFMWPILGVFIVGIMFSFERLISLMLAGVNTKKFIITVTTALKEEGPDAAMDICTKTRGPVASVFTAGLMRLGRGVDQMEKAVMNAGQIELAFLEKNLVWVSTVIAVAPMLGFTGTVSGMIGAFQDIAAANDISPAIVAGGISEALLTTLFGLVVAIIMQIVNNFFIARIDGIVAGMQESSVEFVDTLMKYEEDNQKSENQ